MTAAAETIGYGETLIFIGGIFLMFTILAGLAEICERADEIRRRQQARAEARANRREETDRSDAEWEFSWQ